MGKKIPRLGGVGEQGEKRSRGRRGAGEVGEVGGVGEEISIPYSLLPIRNSLFPFT